MSEKAYSPDCIQLKRKIYNKEVIKMVRTLGQEWYLSDTEVCLRIIKERVSREVEKKKEIAEIIKFNNRK